MCLLLAFFAGVLAVNFYQSGNVVAAVFSTLFAVGFLALMIRNIRATMKRKEEEKGKDDR